MGKRERIEQFDTLLNAITLTAKIQKGDSKILAERAVEGIWANIAEIPETEDTILLGELNEQDLHQRSRQDSTDQTRLRSKDAQKGNRRS
jgi:hypothetical protein